MSVDTSLATATPVGTETLTADELLAGSALRFEVELPAALLGSARLPGGTVRLRPLTVLDL